MKNFIKENRTYLGIILLFLLFFQVSIYYTITRNSGVDVAYLYNRILGLNYSLKNLDMMPQINLFALNGLGYPSPIFYNDWYLYPISLLSLLGIPINILIYLFIFIINILTCALLYKISMKINANKLLSLVISLAFVFNPYRVFLIIKTTRLSEALAQIFIILCLYYFMEILNNNLKKSTVIKLSLSMFMLLLTHNISTLITIFTMIILFLFSIKKINKHILINLVYSGLLFLFLSLGTLLPMLEQITYQDIYLKYISYVNLSDSYHINTLSSIIYNTFTGILLSEGLSIILIIIFIVNSFNKNSIPLKLTIITLIVMYLFVFRLDFVDLTILNTVQFYTRFNNIICLLIIFYLINNKNFLLPKTIFISSLVLLFCQICLVYPLSISFSNNQNINVDNDYTLSIGGGLEYLPSEYVDKIKVSYLEPVDSTNFLSKLNDEIEYNKNDYNKFTVSTKYNYIKIDLETVNATQITLPRISYKGYVLKLNNNKINYHKDDFGMITVDLKKNTKGLLTLEYKLTLIQIISKIISFIVFIVSLYYLYKYKVQEKS